MKGIYKITIGDDVIYEENIITNRGREEILNSISTNKRWADSITVGVGSTSATINDLSLEFLITGTDIQTSIVVPSEDRVYFRAALPSDAQFKFTEIGCYNQVYSNLQNTRDGVGSMLAIFNSLMQWNDISGTYIVDSTNARASADGISYDIASSGTASGYVEIDLDLSTLLDSAELKLAYFNSNIADIILRFKNDDANYYSADTWSVANGYRVDKVQKGNFVATGSPDWSTIKKIEIEVDATASAGHFMLDALRFDTSAVTEQSLLSRVVLGSVKTKPAGKTMDIEYAWELG